MTDYDATIAAYDAASGELAERYDALSPGAAFAAVRDLFPSRGLALDVGAGSGRDARWLASQGFDVVAVEPTRTLRAFGQARSGGSIRWLDDRLPALDGVHRLSLSFDLVLLSAVWQHVPPQDRPRAFRKLATLLSAGGVLVLTLRSGPAPADRPMFETSSGEVEGLARAHGMEVVKVVASDDLQSRADVYWTTVVLRMPDDGTGALPLVRGIVLGDEKSSTYKLGLLRAVARVAEHAPAVATPVSGELDVLEVPLGLVALFWVRMYLAPVRLGLPQAPRNSGPEGLGFAKAGFRALLSSGMDPSELRVGAIFSDETGAAVAAAIGEAASTIASMPANFTRFPNSERRVFEVMKLRSGRPREVALTVTELRRWGTLVVPGHLWRALTRFGPWIEPMLVAEWARLSRSYADRMALPITTGVAEAALEWREPARTTALARSVAERLLVDGQLLECVWSARPLAIDRLDMDHCLPWAVWPCGDLWNLAPSDPRVNRHEKRDRLPSAATLRDGRDRLIGWWERAYLKDAALAERFAREVSASLPVADATDLSQVFSALDWRRLRLLRDQGVPEWVRANPMPGI